MSVGRLAQRRQLDIEDLQPIEEVFAKIAALECLLQIAIGRRNHPHVGLQQPRRRRAAGTRAPAGHAETWPVRMGSSRATSSRNSTPPAASSICPGLACCAPVNAPRS